ncbi:putative transcription factor bHLH family [Helianthus annuus]|nr:putative transcription factor bHLH family [Helianthus annuus]KAJ0736577.1 putative transcription factor bHLH family [Helianthus annuus]KAJ0739521.1 putative transcription factor bHLH family [Helianthus annuus]
MEEEEDGGDDDEAGLRRTEQLIQLYESLSAVSESHRYDPQPRRPPAALSPEDLTDAEWYFLVCMTYEFTNGQGLPGRTLAQNTVSWLSDAHLADSKVFSRSLLAKVSVFFFFFFFITFFIFVLSIFLYNLMMYMSWFFIATMTIFLKSASIQTVVCFPYLEGLVEFGIAEKVLEEQNIIKQIKGLIFDAPPQNVREIPLESCSNMLDHHDLVINNLDNMLEYDQNQEQSWRFVDDDDDEGEISFHHNNSMGSSDCISQNLASGHRDVWSDVDDRYECVLLRIFKNTPRLVLGPRFRNCDSKESAFVSWKNCDGMESNGGCSQVLLKSVLYKVPKMYENRLVWSRCEDGNVDRMRKLEDDDVKDIDHRFSVLSALVPSRGKVDKVSLLDDTIDYLKTLERKVESLQSDRKSHDVRERTCDNYCNKRKASCDPTDLQEERFSDCITVSAIEKDVTIEIRCRWRDNMIVQVFDAMSSLNLESHSVHSYTVDGILTLTIESKLKSCTGSTAKMIRQALQRVIGSKFGVD